MSQPAVSEQSVFHVLYSPGVGGCESLCVDLVRMLQHRGWRQDVIFLEDGDGPTRQRLAALGNVGLHVCPYDPRRRLRFIKHLARLCRAHPRRSMVVYAFGLHAWIAVGARLGGVTRILACVQNPPPDRRSQRWRTALLAQAARMFVAAEVACSRHVAAEMARGYRLPARRLRVIPNWCDVDTIRRCAQASRARDVRQPGDWPRLGMVARLDAIKDHATVLRALARLRQRYPGARVKLIGDGPLRAELTALARQLGLEHAVEFLGTRLDVAEQLGTMDVFTYATTAQEGFGIVLAEAMAAGVPIVATDVGPCAEVLGHGEAGLLVPPADPTALAEGVERVLSDETLRTRLVAAGAARACEHYSGQHAATAFEALLRGQASWSARQERESVPTGRQRDGS